MTPEETSIIDKIKLIPSGKATTKDINAELEKMGSKLRILSSEDIDKSLKTKRQYPVGDNRTRTNGFTYAANEHPLGELLSGIKAKILIESINAAHRLILKGYDMDAYVYDDPRLKAQNEHFRNYIKTNFQHAGYKIEFMNKLVDIIMFLRKEDIYYVRIFDMLETMPRFGLTDEEQSNIDRWH